MMDKVDYIIMCYYWQKIGFPLLRFILADVPSLRLLSLEYYEENRENLIMNRNQSTNISALL